MHLLCCPSADCQPPKRAACWPDADVAGRTILCQANVLRRACHLRRPRPSDTTVAPRAFTAVPLSLATAPYRSVERPQDHRANTSCERTPARQPLHCDGCRARARRPCLGGWLAGCYPGPTATTRTRIRTPASLTRPIGPRGLQTRTRAQSRAHESHVRPMRGIKAHEEDEVDSTSESEAVE